MKISHEVPLCLLEESKNFNQYLYILPCLLKYPEYETFVFNQIEEGVFTILDNDLHEGVTHTDEELLKIVKNINPSIFIVPDVFDNKYKTFDNAAKWMKWKNLGDIPTETNLMAVIQGKTLSQVKDLYLELSSLGYRHIAFNYSSKVYDKIYPHTSQLISRAYGRPLLINILLDDGIIDESIYHHLLGCSLVEEFPLYKDERYPFIKSVDTSNPIAMAFEYRNYQQSDIPYKPKNKIIDIMEVKSFDEIRLNFLSKNLEYFRSKVN
jgi:hypothetical protein